MTVLLQVYGAGTVFLVIAVVAALFGFEVVSDDDLPVQLLLSTENGSSDRG